MQNNVKSSSIAGLLGVFLGAFGGHDWYLGNTKKAITHICLCVGGVMMLMIGLILRNLLRDIPALDLLSICVMIAAYIIIVGNGIWGFIEGVTILAQGDAGLAAKGYQVAAPAMPGAMSAQDPATAAQTTPTEPTAVSAQAAPAEPTTVPAQAAPAEQTIVPDQATASPAPSTAATPAEKSAPAASEPVTNPAAGPSINPTSEPTINPASDPVAAKPIADPASTDTVAAEAASVNPAPAVTPTATTPANPTPVTSSAPESAAITTAATPTNPESATSGTPEAPTPSL